jgi:formate dehydrogenase subunit delta
MSLGTPEKLVRKANQIARFFAAQPRQDAVAGVLDHIRKFWDPRMRAQMLIFLDEGGGAELEPIARAALDQLALENATPLR